MNRKTLFISVAVALVAVFFVATVIFKEQKSAGRQAVTSQNSALLQRTGAPIKGPDSAKVTIVEFFDPACGTCRDFHPVTSQIVEKYQGKVRVMKRYAPLHQGSDQVVKMLEAAHRQGRFWQALELLFTSQNSWVVNHVAQPMRALALLNSLDLDQQRFGRDMNSSEVANVVAKDVQDGSMLQVRATPEFFVNGRPMPSFGYKQLLQLVEEAVQEAY